MSNGFNTSKGVIGWIDYRLPIFSYMNEHLVDYPAPRNLNYLWNFGSLAGIMLVVMIVSGVILAMQYTPQVDMAFQSVERIMRDVNGGWLIRYMHANGASFFFIVVYLHIVRGMYYGSYKAPREILWILGVIILLLMMATAFMGYVLPWGQMSFWGATVITNLFSAIPLIGPDIVTFLWGGFSVGNPTLNRFFALHYLLPFVIFAVVFLHLWALHRFGSNNTLGIDAKGPQDKIPFHPYYTTKDLFGLGVFMMIFAAVIFFSPNLLALPDNYIEANPLSTPAHIVPEWYFLPYYAMLRAITFDIGIPFTDIVLIPAKLGGVITMFASLIVLCFLPWLDSSPVRSGRFRPVFKWFFLILLLDLIALTYLGSKPAEQPYVLAAQFATAFYFIYMLVILPLLGKLERPKPLPASISEAVLKGGAAGASATAMPMEKA